MSEKHPKDIHYVDLHVGQKLRQRRVHMGMDQDGLARRVGVSFQQIQKYERGTNRVSASRLHDLATVLGIPISFFFEDLERGDPHKNLALAERVAAATPADDPMARAETLELTDSFWALPDDSMRQAFAQLLAAMARSED